MDVIFISHVQFLRDALVATLQNSNGNRACGASSRETVEAALVAFAPSMIIVDASHPDGTALVATVRASLPKASVVVLTTGERDEEFLAWADLGISGYLGPDTSAGDLLSAVRRVEMGEVACPPRLTALLLNRFANRSNTERADRAGIFTLTAREREIVELLADGLSNKLIARRLQLALATVKNHVHSVLEKWDCQSRGEAAARYRKEVPDDAKPSGKVVELRASQAPAVNGATLRSGAMQHRPSAAFSHRAA